MTRKPARPQGRAGLVIVIFQKQQQESEYSMAVYQGQEYHTLPYNPMNPERTEATSEIMRQGNTELKRLHQGVLKANKLGPKEYIRAEFRQELFDWLASMNGQVSRRLKPKGRKPSKPLAFVPSRTNNPTGTRVLKARPVAVSNRALSRIVAVQAVQNEVLAGFSRLFERLALQFWRTHRGLSLGVQDYYDEGVMSAINAIYHYTREDVGFFTYVYHCVRRRMGTIVAKDNPLSPWSNEARRLHRVYEDARSALNRPSTFQEVCDYCQFTDAEIRLVEMTMAEVVQAWDSGSSDEDRHRVAAQFELDCVFINGHRPSRNGKHSIGVVDDDDGKLDPDQRAAVARARVRMSPFENAVLDAYLADGEHGWQTRVAEENINPKTGLPYSRRAPAVVWPRIVRTILEEYQNTDAPQREVA